MASSLKYLSGSVDVPVKIVDLSAGEIACSVNRFSDARSLSDFLIPDTDNWDYSCRLISICQKHSWRPLQMTQEMLDVLVERHELGESFIELASCFYQRNLALEETYCVPYTQRRNATCIERVYSVRYPEFKKTSEEWTLRQTGIYHQESLDGSKNLFILLNPLTNSSLEVVVEQSMNLHPKLFVDNPMWLHGLLFDTYFPAWRHYSLSLERSFLPMVNLTWATFIEETLPVDHETLRTFASLRNQFLQIPTILAQSSDVLREIDLTLTNLSKSSLTKQSPLSEQYQYQISQAKNYQRECTTLTRTTSYLQQRAEVMAGFLTGTLSLRDQLVAKQQNNSMVRLNKSAVFITALTLLYLPSSWLATFFGMNFFAMNQATHKLLASSSIWIFVLCAVALTTITMLSYYVLIQHEWQFFSGLSPKPNPEVQEKSTRLEGLKRRLTRTMTAATVEEKAGDMMV